jgi:signal transduction histidine kinase
VPVLQRVKSGVKSGVRASLTWRDGGHPLFVITLGLVIYLAGQYAIWPSSFPLWAHLVGFTLASVTLVLLRRTRPLVALGIGAVLTAVDGVMGLTIPMLLILGDFIYNAVLYAPRRVSRIVGAVVVGGAALEGGVLAFLMPTWRQGILALVVILWLGFLPVWWAETVRLYREAAKAERLRTEQLAELAARDREAAVSAERSRLAADLHDVIAGHLSAIAIQSEAALSLASKDPSMVPTVLQAVRENSIRALREMREMIDLLRADGDRTAPARLHDLDRLMESARASGLQVEATISTNGQLPVTVDLAAYRIIQEALTNVTKHAPGSRATIRLEREGDSLVVDVRNSLTRPRANGEADGTGLASMRTRAEAVGGELSAGEVEGEWRVRAVLPVAERESEVL